MHYYYYTGASAGPLPTVHNVGRGSTAGIYRFPNNSIDCFEGFFRSHRILNSAISRYNFERRLYSSFNRQSCQGERDGPGELLVSKSPVAQAPRWYSRWALLRLLTAPFQPPPPSIFFPISFALARVDRRSNLSAEAVN